MKKVLYISLFILLPVISMAQASGGQIKRDAPKQTKTPVKRVTKSVDYSYSGKENGHEYVDLGLSVKWATCNVGAKTPSESGNYYAWGETKVKTEYHWDTYFDAKDEIGKEFYKYYYGGDGSGLKTISPTSGHDVAREECGENWRMPTPEELNELVTKCKWTFTSYNNVYGQRITGPSGKSIFLPCSGYYSFTRPLGQGSYGWYWSSSLSYNNENGKAVILFFPNYSCENKDELMQNDLRYCGGSVRPVLGKRAENVKQKEQNTTNVGTADYQLLPISGLAEYNIVVGSFSFLGKAKELCQSLRGEGWGAQIYLDSSNLYHVLMIGTNLTPENLIYLKQAQKQYPNAWIMSVENGRTYKYK